MKTWNKISSLIILLILCASSIELSTASVPSGPDVLHYEDYRDGYQSVQDLQVSSLNVNDGDDITVTFTDTNISSRGVSQVSNVMIRVYYGDVDVIFISPEGSVGYNGVPVVSISKTDYGALVVWRFTLQNGGDVSEQPPDDLPGAVSVYTYPSPTTFKATFHLNKRKPVVVDGQQVKPIIVAGQTFGLVGYNVYANLGGVDDLTISKVEVVQRGVVNPDKIIANEGVFFKVYISSTFKTIQSVPVTVVYDFGTQHYSRVYNVMPDSSYWSLMPNYYGTGPPRNAVYKLSIDPQLLIVYNQNGTDEIRFLVDPENVIKETNEKNNEYTLTEDVVLISSPPGLPDLTQILGGFKISNLFPLMKTDPKGTTDLMRKSAFVYFGKMNGYLGESLKWAQNLPIPNSVMGSTQIKSILGGLCVAQKASLSTLMQVSGPYEIELDVSKTMYGLSTLGGLFDQIAARTKDATLPMLQQNTDQLTEAQGILSSTISSLEPLFKQVDTLSASNNPEDVIKLEQTMTMIQTLFYQCDKMIRAINDMNRAIIDKMR